jgi:hypothetical protein
MILIHHTGMKLKRIPLIIIFLLSASNITADELRLFQIGIVEKATPDSVDVALISLSDIYLLSEHPDSLAIPDVSGKTEAESKYLKLNGAYRKRFLSGAKILETDKVFIYDYSTSSLKSFSVKSLQVVACLNIYGAEFPYTQFDYMIGFEIERKLLTGFDKYFENTLVAFGKTNPFLEEQLKKVVWKKSDQSTFSLPPINSKDSITLNKFFAQLNYEVSSEYEFISDEHHLFIQDITIKESQWTSAKRLIVVDAKSKKVTKEKIFYNGESATFAPLQNQWTGKLFKNKPPVIFGFQYISFGCPHLTFLDNISSDIYINCDNRH